MVGEVERGDANILVLIVMVLMVASPEVVLVGDIWPKPFICLAQSGFEEARFVQTNQGDHVRAIVNVLLACSY